MDDGLLGRAQRLREAWSAAQSATDPAARARLTAVFRVEHAAVLAPYDRACELLSAGDLSGVEDALRFLETRPRFFRSGYLAEKLIRRLGRLELGVRDRPRFGRALERIVAEAPTREQGVARSMLARVVADN